MELRIQMVREHRISVFGPFGPARTRITPEWWLVGWGVADYFNFYGIPRDPEWLVEAIFDSPESVEYTWQVGDEWVNCQRGRPFLE